MNEIHPDINSIGRYMEPLGLYNPYSGTTTNQSEGFNTVMKRFDKWKEAPLDSVIFSLYQLQTYYYNEIQRGLCQCGDYKLTTDFASLARDPDEVKLINTIPPHLIVKRVRNEGARAIDTECNVDAVGTECNVERKSVATYPSSQNSRASLVVADDRISFDSKLGVFVVRNSEGHHHAVTLFPKQSCTCPSTGECYHIISAKMSLGMETKQTKTVVNLSQLRRNTRSRKGKKFGKKRYQPPLANPAPDSIAAQSILKVNNEAGKDFYSKYYLKYFNFIGSYGIPNSDYTADETIVTNSECR